MEPKTTLFADFSNRADADIVVHSLETLGYEPKDISVIAKGESGKPVAEDAAGHTEHHVIKDATTGGVIGGVAGLLAGAGVAPVLAGFLFGGPVAVALGLAGVAAVTVSGVVSGGIVGGLIGALKKIGVSDEDATYYEKSVANGGVVLGVPVRPDNETQVKELLSRAQTRIARVTQTAV